MAVNERIYTLRIRQAYPLKLKLEITKIRIRQWYEHWEGQVYVAFSGGKDSTVLLDIVRSMYPEVAAVFANTGREFKEIYDFIRKIPHVEWVTPKYTYEEVIKKYGYPVVSKEVSQKIYEVRNTQSEKLKNKRLHGDGNKYKSGKIPEKWKYLIEAPFKISHKCCDYLKKEPFKRFEKRTGLKPIVGTMALESHLRRQKYGRVGCNSFEGKIESNPLSHWTTEDVWEYIRLKDLPYSTIYDMGYERTGCVDCLFGVHMEEKGNNRFDKMRKTHPNRYKDSMVRLGAWEPLEWVLNPYVL